MSGLNVPSKICKRENGTSPHETIQKDFKTIEESIKQFHANIAIGPVCTCCHQTWFRKSVFMLKNTHIQAQREFLEVSTEQTKEKRHFCNDKATFFAHLVYVIVSS